MEQEFNKMTIKGQKSAILLVRALLNSPEQFDYIKDTYLIKRHGSWQLKDKLSVMLDPKTKHEVNYLSKIVRRIVVFFNSFNPASISSSATIPPHIR